MTPEAFVAKWAASQLKEMASYASHFDDLCELLGHDKPAQADPQGDFFTFQKGAPKIGGGDGWADVWYRDAFGWEYKGKLKDLDAAYKQLVLYREALLNPPLLVVCDFEEFRVHTQWTGMESWVYSFRNADIAEPTRQVTVRTASGSTPKDAPRLSALDLLRKLFYAPQELRPGVTTLQITAKAARQFGFMSAELRAHGIDEMRVARLITKVLFCMFASDVGLLPRGTFSSLLENHKNDPATFQTLLKELFRKMNEPGSYFGADKVPWFNGELFADDDVPEKLNGQHIRDMLDLDKMNWADVEPVIFGTLFENVLSPAERQKLGAHYTSRADIELIVEPVLMAPLRREWEQVRKTAEDAIAQADSRRALDQTKRQKLAEILGAFVDRLGKVRVLDPACGSGNFLYVSLALLKTLEKEAQAFGMLYGVAVPAKVHPRQLAGIEVNHYAHELASIVVWIGYLQWKHKNGMPLDDEEPVLQRLDQIVLKDAVLDLSDPANPKEPEWPEADVIVGNPPFLGGKKLRTGLGDEYVDRMFRLWDGRVPREADYVCYWFEKARAQIEAKKAKRAGLLATQAIRGGKNRKVLERIKETGDIFYAQADPPVGPGRRGGARGDGRLRRR